jgi:hypothetical protein
MPKKSGAVDPFLLVVKKVASKHGAYISEEARLSHDKPDVDIRAIRVALRAMQYKWKPADSLGGFWKSFQSESS